MLLPLTALRTIASSSISTAGLAIYIHYLSDPTLLNSSSTSEYILSFIADQTSSSVAEPVSPFICRARFGIYLFLSNFWWTDAIGSRAETSVVSPTYLHAVLWVSQWVSEWVNVCAWLLPSLLQNLLMSLELLFSIIKSWHTFISIILSSTWQGTELSLFRTGLDRTGDNVSLLKLYKHISWCSHCH